MKASLFVLWFLAACSYAIAAALAALSVYRLRMTPAGLFALAFAGVAFEGAMAAGSLILFWPTEADVAPGFAVSRAVGRTVAALCLWPVALYLLNLCNRGRKVGAK